MTDLHPYIENELCRLIALAEQHGLTDLVKRLLAAKDALRVQWAGGAK